MSDFGSCLFTGHAAKMLKNFNIENIKTEQYKYKEIGKNGYNYFPFDLNFMQIVITLSLTLLQLLRAH